MKHITFLFTMLAWLPIASTTLSATSSKKTTLPLTKSTKPTPQPEHKSQPTVTAAVASLPVPPPATHDLPLITVFNTARTDENHSIVIKAHCVIKNFGNIETRITKTLGTVTNPEEGTVQPLSEQVLQVPKGTVELWAQDKTPFNTLRETERIPFNLKQTTSAFIFSIKEGNPHLEAIPLFSQNTLFFYNQTDTKYTLNFFTSSSDIFSYLSGKLSFSLPANTIVTLPVPTNAKKFSIGTTTVTSIPTSKTVFILTHKTPIQDPVIMQLTLTVA